MPFVCRSSLTIAVKVDLTKPKLAGMPAAGCTLWPPNGKLATVATFTATDGLSGVAAVNVTVTSSDLPGKDPDWVVTGSGASAVLQLKADRTGQAARTYTITATATDNAGNQDSATGTCIVPHDQSAK